MTQLIVQLRVGKMDPNGGRDSYKHSLLQMKPR